MDLGLRSGGVSLVTQILNNYPYIFFFFFLIYVTLIFL